MKSIVLDCSIVMAWCFEDEASRETDALLDSLTNRSARVPSIWTLEVANVLLVAERAHRLKEAETAQFLALLQSLPIHVEVDTSQYALREILALGREHHLSSYDAAYLELAMRKGLPLATKDHRLRQMAAKLGIES